MLTLHDIARMVVEVSDGETEKERLDLALILADMYEELGRPKDASWVRTHLEDGCDPRETLRRLYARKLESCVNIDSGLPYVSAWRGLNIAVSFASCQLNSLDVLQEMPYLRYLDVSFTNVNDDDMHFLEDMHELRQFVAAYTDLGTPTLERLSKLPELRRVSMQGCPVTEDAVEPILAMADRLSTFEWDACFLPTASYKRLRDEFAARKYRFTDA